MSERTITLSSEIADQLEALAKEQGRSVEALLGGILTQQQPPQNPVNWALTLAEDMENADIDWIVNPSASTQSTSNFGDDRYQQWLETQ